jgi:predicted RNA-binding Zn-ribbon protein involved in translation (DUF1610 family)
MRTVKLNKMKAAEAPETPPEEVKAEVQEVTPEVVETPQPAVTVIPKNYVIRCGKCCWSRTTTGLKVDLADLHEIANNCPTCGKWRKFTCPKCGNHAVMRKIVYRR